MPSKTIKEALEEIEETSGIYSKFIKEIEDNRAEFLAMEITPETITTIGNYFKNNTLKKKQPLLYKAFLEKLEKYLPHSV